VASKIGQKGELEMGLTMMSRCRVAFVCVLMLLSSIQIPAGAVDGPKTYSGTLDPATAGTHPTDFVGGQRAIISIKCDGVYMVTVTDQDGNDYAGPGYSHKNMPANTPLTLHWDVPTTQKFFISIFHRDSPNKKISYTIETN
jgi:hypothetical protein